MFLFCFFFWQHRQRFGHFSTEDSSRKSRNYKSWANEPKQRLSKTSSRPQTIYIEAQKQLNWEAFRAKCCIFFFSFLTFSFGASLNTLHDSTGQKFRSTREHPKVQILWFLKCTTTDTGLYKKNYQPSNSCCRKVQRFSLSGEREKQKRGSTVGRKGTFVQIQGNLQKKKLTN